MSPIQFLLLCCLPVMRSCQAACNGAEVNIIVKFVGTRNVKLIHDIHGGQALKFMDRPNFNIFVLVPDGPITLLKSWHRFIYSYGSKPTGTTERREQCRQRPQPPPVARRRCPHLEPANQTNDDVTFIRRLQTDTKKPTPMNMRQLRQCQPAVHSRPYQRPTMNQSDSDTPPASDCYIAIYKHGRDASDVLRQKPLLLASSLWK